MSRVVNEKLLPELAVVGCPVDHSLSPAIFQCLSEKLGRPLVYEKLNMNSAQDLHAKLKELRETDAFLGWNVTLPYKEDAVSVVDWLSPEAERIGAVNLVKKESKTLYGFNTDFIGVLACFEESKVPLYQGSFVVYGAGGAAKAVAFALGQGGAARVSIVNRAIEKANELAKKMSSFFPRTVFIGLGLDSSHLCHEAVSACINATALGMKGVLGSLPLPKNHLPQALALDLVYGTGETQFLCDARDQGYVVQDGLDMLIWQALAGWEIWFEKMKTSEKILLKNSIKDHLMDKIEGRSS